MGRFEIPNAYQAVILFMAAARLTRLAGWDAFPLAARIRGWATGEHEVYVEDVPEGAEKAQGTGRVDAGELGLPGKLPVPDVSNVRVAYRRPMIAHLVHCPFCLGWWTCLAVYAAWLLAPRWTLYACVPLALSSAVGWASRNLDP